jgi:hypothetical protein
MPIDTKAQGLLSVQIDACADALPDLIRTTRVRSNAAIVAGDLDSAMALDTLSLRYSQQFSTVLQHQLAEIDDSAQMKDLIKQFADVNRTINNELQSIADIARFIEVATGVANALDKAIGFALKAAAFA